MTRSPLHVRLALASVISIVGALILSGVFLMFLFERHVIRRVEQELSVYVKQLAAALTSEPDGTITLTKDFADPRFERPFSGLYWQVERNGRPVLQSRSLWDQSLNPPSDAQSTTSPARYETNGPDNKVIIVMARNVYLETEGGNEALRLAAAINKDEVTQARSQFLRDLVIALTALAAALIAAAWLQIAIGLRPLKQIRQRINDIRTGSTSRLQGKYPSEVQLLVDEVNALLSASVQAIERARDSAADLAHGLKTPLAVLQAESRALQEQHLNEPAREILAQVDEMRNRVERHLAVVRMRGTTHGAVGRTDAAQAFEKIIKAMKHMPRGDTLEWRCDIQSDLVVPLDDQDFYEVFGNILDNARKFAKSTVSVTANKTADGVEIIIEDNGPGIPGNKRADVLKRGRQLDEVKGGSGLGLPIAQRIIDAYDADLKLEQRPEGGLRIRVILKQAGRPS